MLVRYFVNDFEMLLFPPVTTCVTIVFTFHIHCISVVKSLCFKTFLASFIMKLQCLLTDIVGRQVTGL